MGWATGDEPRVEDAKVKLSQTKAAAYNLESVIKTIEHDEKKYALFRQVDNLNIALREIERGLYR